MLEKKGIKHKNESDCKTDLTHSKMSLNDVISFNQRVKPLSKFIGGKCTW